MAPPLRRWDRTPIMYESLRELDHRTSDRIDVWLLWREHDNQVLVSVADEKTGDFYIHMLSVPGDMVKQKTADSDGLFSFFKIHEWVRRIAE